MMKRIFATFDANGLPEGFYPSDVHSNPPSQAVEISIKQYKELLEHPHGTRKYISGEVVADREKEKEFVPIKVYTSEELFDEFTKLQWAEIRRASKTDEEIEYLMDKVLSRSRPIPVDNKMLIDGLDYLVYKKLITQEDRNRILIS